MINGENYPYTNFHDLNLDWILKVVKDFLDKYTTLNDTIDNGTQSINTLATDVLAQIDQLTDEKKAELLLYVQTECARVLAQFTTDAESRASTTIASIPQDYTSLYNTVLKCCKYPYADNSLVFLSPYLGTAQQLAASRIRDVKIYGWSGEYTYYVDHIILNKTVNGNPLTYVAIRAKNSAGTIDAYAFLVNVTGTFSGVKTYTVNAYNNNIFAGYKAEITVDYNSLDASGIDITLSATIAPLAPECNAGFYPWGCARPQNANASTVYTIVKDIQVYGAKLGDRLYIRQFAYKWSSFENRTYITVYNENTGAKVCEYTNIVSPTTETVIHLEEFLNSGISADMRIDFSAISANFLISSFNPTYNDLGISEKCYVHSEEDTVNILLPDTIFAVVGFETNIYWDATIQAQNLNDYQVIVIGNGENLGNRWHYIPASAGTFDITIEVRNNEARLITSKVVHVVAKAKAIPNPYTIKALHLGDSMIDNPYHIPELVSDFAGTNITYTTEGTRNNGRDEGRGGWSSTMYTSLAESDGVTNPFFNPSTEQFDFSYYMTYTGLSDPDYVFIMLGTNDIKGTSTFSGIADGCNATLKAIQEIVASIKYYDADIKVCICTAPIGANQQYPFGTMYHDNRIKQPLHKYGIQFQTYEYLKVFGGRESEGIYVIPTGQALDNVNGFPTETVQASARIPVNVTVQSDPYHPTEYGYYQMADTEFAFIRNQLN